MASGGGTSVSETPEYVRDAHEAILRGTVTDSDSIFGTMNNLLYLTKNSTINESDYKTLYTYSPQSLVNNLTTVRNRINSRVASQDYSETWPTVVTEVKNSLLSSIREDIYSNISSDITTMLSDVLTEVSSVAQNRMDEIPGLSNSAINSITQNSQATIRSVVDNFANDVYDNLNDFRTESVTNAISYFNQTMSNAINGVETLIDSALTKALELAGQTIVEDAVDAFEDETEIDYLRGVGRMAGEASVAGIANSSGFSLSKVILEESRSRSVNKFRADLKLRIVELVMSLHPNSVVALTNSGLQSFRDQLSAKLETYRLDLTEKFRMYGLHISESFKFLELATQTDHATYERLHQGYFNSFTEKLRSQELKESYFMLEGVKQVLNLYEKYNIEDQAKLFEVEKTLGAFELAAFNEYYDKKHEYNRASNQDDFEKMTRAANIIAAFGGGTSTIVDKPSKGQSVMAGVAGGAGIGAGVAGVPGAIAGGIIGGLGSLIK